jgi:hypothetical protein
MKKYVIVATRGRAAETAVLFDYLLEQDTTIDGVYVIGSDLADIAGLDTHALGDSTNVMLLLSTTPGLTIQRNVGVSRLLADHGYVGSTSPWFAAFFDDDFRPGSSWLRQCDAVFEGDASIVGLTGQVLADGIKTLGIMEADARQYLDGTVAPMPHWASGDARREIGSAYGCNMAFTARVVEVCRFDESLPLYGWQEDHDYTSQARRLGLFVYEPTCQGVHLGVKKGRQSGVRFGYSQIANPLFLMKKKTMDRKKAWRFMLRNLLSNIFHSVRGDPVFDYRGRLRGNLMAMIDQIRGTNHPLRILEI